LKSCCAINPRLRPKPGKAWRALAKYGGFTSP
jgi:hypothetical protein